MTMGVTFVLGALGSMWIPAALAPGLRALLFGVCAGFLPLFYVSKKRAKRIDALETLLPDALLIFGAIHARWAREVFTISLEMVEKRDPRAARPGTQEGYSIEQNLGCVPGTIVP